MVSQVKADVESLEYHVKSIKRDCEAMLESSKKFSSNVSGSVWSDNNAGLAVDVYGRVAHSLENVIQILDGASEILDRQVGCLKDYYNVII